MNNQPNKEHTTSPDVKIMYEEMVRRQNEVNAKVHDIVEKRKDRMEAETVSRAMWDGLSYDERVIRSVKLINVLNSLVDSHPDYSCFQSVNIFYGEKPGYIKIRWDAANIENSEGWGSIDREFPESHIPEILKRYQDRMRLMTKDEEV
ncbi:MAG TPA: hypothetical protein ENH82_09695 [bacterium]|nr:hypothetical protein [bacterium]